MAPAAVEQILPNEAFVTTAWVRVVSVLFKPSRKVLFRWVRTSVVWPWSRPALKTISGRTESHCGKWWNLIFPPDLLVQTKIIDVSSDRNEKIIVFSTQ